MFYSQFILAKKGPLGTIWIAAHLERKLKKNQVADTDIGDSVDSILFPDVPIALRLSSHLLLGVVRIYSRKVNYLFHDCSEALLKIKQAFRSTAVDLPPEESTAPYHAITLPETFDLDDFELPESAFLSGNFVDHHVSSRDQITLQDTLDASGYSISQFGLDERFGDEDASQIGLDLDEELLMDSGRLFQRGSVPMTFGESSANEGDPNDQNQYGNTDYMHVETSNDLSAVLGNDRGKHVVSYANLTRNDDASNQHMFNIQTPDLNEIFLPDDHMGGPSTVPNATYADFAAVEPSSPEFIESAHAPSTPGLLDEGIPANVQESSALSPRDKVDADHATTNNSHTDVKPAYSILSPTEPRPDSEAHKSSAEILTSPVALTGDMHEVPMDPNHQFLSSEDLAPGILDSLAPRNSDQILPASDVAQVEPAVRGTESIHDLPIGEEATHASISDQGYSKENVTDNPAVASGINGSSFLKTPSHNGSEDQVKDAQSCLSSHISISSSDFQLRSCSSHLNQTNISSLEDMLSARSPPGNSLGEAAHTYERSDEHQGELSLQKSSFISTDPNVGANNLDDLFGSCVSTLAHTDPSNCTSSSQFPEPEKMLFAPSGDTILPNDLGQQTADKGVTESDGSVDRISTLSGKKLDNTPAVQDGMSTHVTGMPRKRKYDKYIPEDDDLLASILVGRKTPAFLTGSTPPIPKITSLKRPRMTTRVGLTKKRKVLLDDTMVIHADAIRQQLISTEDIRRLRKKAPCTRPEIWRIMKSLVEDDIFSDPIFTDLSEDLIALQTKTYVNVPTSSEIVRETGGKGTAAQYSELPERIDHQQLEPSLPSIQPEILASNQASFVTSEVNGDGSNAVEIGTTSLPPSGNEFGVATKSISTVEGNADESREVELEPQTCSKDGGKDDENCLVDNTTLIAESGHNDSKIASLMEDDSSKDMVDAVNIGRPEDDHITAGNTEEAVVVNGELTSMAIPGEYQEASKAGQITADGESDKEKVLIDEEIPSVEMERATSAVGENSSMQEPNINGDLVFESSPMDFAAARETSDFCSATAINDLDTEFLNADDNIDYDEEADDDEQNKDAGQVLENSGWSTRTRGVAKYLKIMFNEESGHGRKSVAVDQLLAGKTRKEASRMFFETLVLKTRDYIQVEQQNPFDNIDIKPKVKLMKSEF